MVPIREFIVLDGRARARLAECPPAEWTAMVAELMMDSSMASRTAEASAHAAFKRGEIDGRQCDQVLGWLAQDDVDLEERPIGPNP